MKNKNEQVPVKSELILYQTEDGKTKIEVRLQGETVWLTLNQMAELFQVDKSGISRHLKNIYETRELMPDTTVANFATVQQEGARSVTRNIEYYNLDAIISVGYRVNSIRGTQFRIWATQRLKEYIIKGFTLDDDRLKQASGGRYFEELLARIRDIRSSEKIFWRKVLDIYATSIDYDPDTEISQKFFTVLQNKMHWAAHGHTAAEIIFHRADAYRKNMGMMTWAGDKPRKTDAEIAKNYLSEKELDILNRIVSMYLDFAELQALSRKPMHMQDWIEKLDEFLTISGRDILTHAGTISHAEALKKAHDEYEQFIMECLKEPSQADRQFWEAVTKLKKIEKSKKNRLKK
jgi:hypothetical protein